MIGNAYVYARGATGNALCSDIAAKLRDLNLRCKQTINGQDRVGGSFAIARGNIQTYIYVSQ
jgi:hypothetical protein